MARNRKLHTAARDFADRIALIINQTVATSVRLSVYSLRNDEVYVSTASTSSIAKSNPIQIATGVPFAFAWLNIGYNLMLDVEDHLTVFKSVFALKAGAGAEHELFRFDYSRHPSEYPDAHLQVFGDYPPLTQLLTAVDLGKTRKEHLHFPVGGRRYRPIIEDVLEFLIVERIVKLGETETVVALGLLEEQRARFRKTQLAAAIRNNPEAAAAALDALGYDVKKRKHADSPMARVVNLIPGQLRSGSTKPRRKH